MRFCMTFIHFKNTKVKQDAERGAPLRGPLGASFLYITKKPKAWGVGPGAGARLAYGILVATIPQFWVLTSNTFSS